GAIAIQERVAANSRVRVLPWGAAPARHVEAPADEAAFVMRLKDNPEPAVAHVRYTYASLVSPTTVYDLDLRSGERRLRKVDPVPSSARSGTRMAACCTRRTPSTTSSM